MKKYVLLATVLLLIPALSFAATYYRRNNGTAADKAAATGPCTDLTACMNRTVYDGETFTDGDVIVDCHVLKQIPGEIWSRSYIDKTFTLSIPASVNVLWANLGDTITWDSGGDRVSW